MRWKESLTPLDAVPDLDPEIRDRLAAHHITTAEELIGQIEAEPANIRELLQLDGPAMDDLERRARKVIDPGVARSIREQRGRTYATGALPPDDQSS